MMHFSPLAGYVDHGFYSISPSLFLEFYRCNGYQILAQEIEFVMDRKEKGHERWDSVFSQDCRLFPEWGQKKDINGYLRRVAQIPRVGRMLLWSIAKKKGRSDELRNPVQNIWKKTEGWDNGRKH